MVAKLRIGFVTTYDPARGDMGGAAWVDQQLLNSLSHRFDITTILVSDESDSEPIDLEVRRNPKLAVQTVLRMVGRSEPYQVAKFHRAPGWSSRVKDLQRLRSSIDFVVTSQWPALLLATDAGLAIDLHVAHNVDYLLAEKYDPRAFRILSNAARTRRFELDLLGRATRVLAISRNDAHRLRRHGIAADHIRLIDAPPRQHSPQAKRSIGFIGKGSWPPNAEAIDSLVEVVLPRVRNELGSKSPRLVIAGRDTEKWSQSGVVVMGPVSDVAEFYRQVDLVVVPRVGTTTGVSVKLLEAVERGVPVIAPKQLISDAGVSQSCVPADTPADIARQIAMYYSGQGQPQGDPTAGELDGSMSLGELANAIGRDALGT